MVVGCADAGKDQRVKSNAEVVLDASASKPDFQGKIVRYKWKQIRGKRVELSNSNNVRTTFIAPSVTKRTKLLFKLTTVEKGGYRSPWKTTDTVAVRYIDSHPARCQGRAQCKQCQIWSIGTLECSQLLGCRWTDCRLCVER